MDAWIVISTFALTAATIACTLVTGAAVAKDMSKDRSKDIATVSDNDTEVAKSLIEVIDKEIDARKEAEK